MACLLVGFLFGRGDLTATYSVKTFTTSPGDWPADTVTQIVVMVETFFGTLLIILLGYVPSNRERF